jgi:hypothetical protein
MGRGRLAAAAVSDGDARWDPGTADESGNGAGEYAVRPVSGLPDRPTRNTGSRRPFFSGTRRRPFSSGTCRGSERRGEGAFS